MEADADRLKKIEEIKKERLDVIKKNAVKK